MKSTLLMQAPFGVITLVAENGFLTHLTFGQIDGIPDSENQAPLTEAARQLQEYFAGQRTVFDLPLRITGTPFQQRVWRALQAIPYGETRSYKEIAELVDCPCGYRAVGMANNRNPISIIIPCHRVISASGELAGYGGGLKIKEWLLSLEKER